MDIENVSGFTLKGLGPINVLLGKNGCGKSYLLRQIEQGIHGQNEYGVVKYFSPERGGFPLYEAGIEQAISADPNWLSNSRRRNQAAQFRQQSAVQFVRLETSFLRELEKDPNMRADLNVTFDSTVDRINALLDRVQIRRADTAFEIVDLNSGDTVQPQDISSGEAELISISIECLMFERECNLSKHNLLLFDEPDVHLHSDLQSRLASFIASCSSQASFTLIIATHSTPLLAALSATIETRLALMRFGETEISFSPVSDTHRKILPVFGAHPLSNVFNKSPVLLVEGDDDERIWQQAVRSSKGRIRAYPCSVNGIGQLPEFETRAAALIEAVYDNAIGYSIRDRDDRSGEGVDLGPIRRMTLACRSAENLLLTDEVLISSGITWDELAARIRSWLENNPQHPHFHSMKAFESGGFDRLSSNLKDIRNDIVAMLGTNKPWEVVVGQSIAGIAGKSAAQGATTLASFLGPRIVRELLR